MYDAVIVSFTATRNSLKNLGATTSVHVAPDDGFKRCCMTSGRYDGSERGYYLRTR